MCVATYGNGVHCWHIQNYRVIQKIIRRYFFLSPRERFGNFIKSTKKVKRHVCFKHRASSMTSPSTKKLWTRPSRIIIDNFFLNNKQNELEIKMRTKKVSFSHSWNGKLNAWSPWLQFVNVFTSNSFSSEKDQKNEENFFLNRRPKKSAMRSNVAIIWDM